MYSGRVFFLMGGGFGVFFGLAVVFPFSPTIFYCKLFFAMVLSLHRLARSHGHH